ncbi:hypothetical protein GGR96_001159 [Thalassospira tepidiphila]|uniref:Uncharacterized protein n=1 Tax=Thalassospira tepidiphila TaxID=393657 RepID=A0ABX0WXN0_9PROT|nr:hypothetical protein [Thalassospira tepidiphila]
MRQNDYFLHKFKSLAFIDDYFLITAVNPAKFVNLPSKPFHQYFQFVKR